MGVVGFRSSIAVSVVLHIFVMALCAYLASQRAALPQKKITWIELDPSKIPDPARKRANEDDIKKHQLVQTDPGHLTDKAAPDAFLGERTQIVDRQTVSHQKQTVIAKPSSAQKVAKRAQSATEQKKSAQAEASPAVPLQNLGIPLINRMKELAQAEARGELNDRWATPGARAQDYVKGMRESDMTALNTREYVFYGYYQRIRERLDRAWVPILRQKIVKLYTRGRQLASDMDHTTRVNVVLNNKGEIIKIQILTESGSQDLDDAAVGAFQSAGPFPNPPKGIIDARGEVEIPWEFILRS